LQLLLLFLAGLDRSGDFIFLPSQGVATSVNRFAGAIR
jgi:hypothetical protein